jgi:hypothetical protein
MARTDVLTTDRVTCYLSREETRKDAEKVLEWLKEGSATRCRAADRLAEVIHSEAESASDAEAAAVLTDSFVEPVIEPKRTDSQPPPAPVPVHITVETTQAAPVNDGSRYALLAIRRLWDEWSGGTYVCGNAYRRMIEIDRILASHGLPCGTGLERK